MVLQRAMQVNTIAIFLISLHISATIAGELSLPFLSKWGFCLFKNNSGSQLGRKACQRVCQRRSVVAKTAVVWSLPDHMNRKYWANNFEGKKFELQEMGSISLLQLDVCTRSILSISIDILQSLSNDDYLRNFTPRRLHPHRLWYLLSQKKLGLVSIKWRIASFDATFFLQCNTFPSKRIRSSTDSRLDFVSQVERNRTCLSKRFLPQKGQELNNLGSLAKWISLDHVDAHVGWRAVERQSKTPASVLFLSESRSRRWPQMPS